MLVDWPIVSDIEGTGDEVDEAEVGGVGRRRIYSNYEVSETLSVPFLSSNHRIIVSLGSEIVSYVFEDQIY